MLQIDRHRVKFTTDRMIVVVDSGTISAIHNRLTETDYMIPLSTGVPGAFATGLHYLPDVVPMGHLPASPKEIGANAVAFEFTAPDGSSALTLHYSLDTETGDLVVRQHAQGSRTGLVGVQLSLNPITCRGNLLLPCFNGVKAARTNGYTYGPTCGMPDINPCQWPTIWQLPLAIFDDVVGGVWVHTRDTERRFKQMSYQYEGRAAWRTAFQTENFAPFDACTSAESVTWRINTYEGDWTVPLGTYKTWAYGAYDLVAKAASRPAWVTEIRLAVNAADCIWTDQIAPFLDRLAEHAEPSKTLLTMEYWKKSQQTSLRKDKNFDVSTYESGDLDKDAHIPNHLIGDHGIKFNQEARRRGFRTMYFSNHLSIATTHPLFEAFKPYFVRNPYTHNHDPYGFNLNAEWASLNYEPLLYYVNPGHKPWRDYLVGQLTKLFEEYPADALYLDQTLVILNDQNGLLDGQSMIDGNLAYHREVAEALPGIAIGGEGINEISMQYESFCGCWYLGDHLEVDDQGVGWWVREPEACDRMVPLVSRYLMPHTRQFTCPMGLRSIDLARYSPTALAGIYGGILTLARRPTMDELRDPDSEARRVIRAAMRTTS